MAIPPANTQVSTRVLTEFSVGRGLYKPDTTNTQATASLPIPNPPELLAVDAVKFQIPSSGQGRFVFPNIPIRSTSSNPFDITQVGQHKLTILPQDILIMDIALFDCPIYVQTSSYAITTNKTFVPGPFMGGATYETFGGLVTGPAGTSGMIVSKLYIQRGTHA